MRCFSEVNPIPAKAALSMMNRCQNILRLPLVNERQASETEGRNGKAGIDMSNTLLISGIHGRMGEALTQAEGGFPSSPELEDKRRHSAHSRIQRLFWFRTARTSSLIFLSSLLASLLDYAVSKQRPCVWAPRALMRRSVLNQQGSRTNPVFYSPICPWACMCSHCPGSCRMLPQYDIEIVNATITQSGSSLRHGPCPV